MVINSYFISKITGLKWNIQYEELDNIDSIKSLPNPKQGGACGAICFCGDKMVVVYSSKKDSWSMPGGGLEEGETLEECIIREIKEETNMRVLELYSLGYDTFTNPENSQKIYQVRFAAKVEPYGPFLVDGAEDEQDITEIKFIDSRDYKKYFDWGERSDAMVEKARKLIFK